MKIFNTENEASEVIKLMPEGSAKIIMIRIPYVTKMKYAILPIQQFPFNEDIKCHK